MRLKCLHVPGELILSLLQNPKKLLSLDAPYLPADVKVVRVDPKPGTTILSFLIESEEYDETSTVENLHLALSEKRIDLVEMKSHIDLLRAMVAEAKEAKKPLPKAVADIAESMELIADMLERWLK